MLRKIGFMVFVVLVFAPVNVIADELAKIIQLDLVKLGYDPGNINGEVNTKTVVAVSKFQAEHNLDVTGELTPQLAGVIKAAIKEQDNPASSTQPAVAAQTTPEQDAAALQAAQQACLQEKYLAAQESKKKKRGFGRLLRAVSRTASQIGGNSLAGDLGRTASDIYSVNATAEDLAGAAEDLGLTEDDLEECRNPG